MTAFAPMGLGDDPRAVVDENGKVDVSTTILIAENVADRIKAASS
jgi:hypothetical protein